MAMDFLSIGISIAMFIIYLGVVITLFYLLPKSTGSLKKFVKYLIAAVFTLILLRIQAILSKAQILIIPYSQEVLALVLCLVLLGMALRLYRTMHKVIKFNKKSQQKRKKSYKTGIKRVSTSKSRLNNGYLDLTK